jgi:hypothetical protein
MSYNPYNKNRGPSLLSQGLGQAIGEAITGAENLSDKQKKRRNLALLLTGVIGARDARKEFNVKKTVDALIDSQKLETAKLDRAFNQKEELLTKKKLVNLSPTEAFRPEAELRFKDAHQDSIDMYTGPNVGIAARRAKEQWIQQDIANVLIPHFEKQYELLNMDETGSLTKEEFQNPSMAYHKARILKETRPENLSVLHKPLARLRDLFGIERYDAEDSRLKSLKEAHEKRLNNVANFNKYDQNNMLAKRAALTEDDKDKIVLSNEEFRQAYRNTYLPDELFDEALDDFKASEGKNWGEFKKITMNLASNKAEKLIDSKIDDAMDLYNYGLESQKRIKYKDGTKEIDWDKTKELDNGISEAAYNAQRAVMIGKVMGVSSSAMKATAEIYDLLDSSEYKKLSEKAKEEVVQIQLKEVVERKIYGESRTEFIRGFVNSASARYHDDIRRGDSSVLNGISTYRLNREEYTKFINKLKKENLDANTLETIYEQMQKRDHLAGLDEKDDAYGIIYTKLKELHRDQHTLEATSIAENITKNLMTMPSN